MTKEQALDRLALLDEIGNDIYRLEKLPILNEEDQKDVFYYGMPAAIDKVVDTYTKARSKLLDQYHFIGERFSREGKVLEGDENPTGQITLRNKEVIDYFQHQLKILNLKF